MKIFISQSGETSHNLANIFSDWIKNMFYTVNTFISDEIPKGDDWNETINRELESLTHCLVFLTRDNLKSPWIHFEAGKISKNRDKSKVFTILFELKPTDIERPLSMFQATELTKEDIYMLIKSINNDFTDKLDEQRLMITFDKWWPDLEIKLKSVQEQKAISTKTPLRKPDEMVVEILELVRGMDNKISNLRPIKEIVDPFEKINFLYNLYDTENNEEFRKFIRTLIMVENDKILEQQRVEKRLNRNTSLLNNNNWKSNDPYS